MVPICLCLLIPHLPLSSVLTSNIHALCLSLLHHSGPRVTPMISSLNKKYRAPGWLSWLSVDFSTGHDLAVCELEPCIRLCVDSSEPGACFGFCVSLSLSAPPHSLSLSLSKIDKHKKKNLEYRNICPTPKLILFL